VPYNSQNCHARERFRRRGQASDAVRAISAWLPGTFKCCEEIPSEECDFRISSFLKSGSLFFQPASVIFLPSQHAEYPAKDGITEK